MGTCCSSCLLFVFTAFNFCHGRYLSLFFSVSVSGVRSGKSYVFFFFFSCNFPHLSVSPQCLPSCRYSASLYILLFVCFVATQVLIHIPRCFHLFHVCSLSYKLIIIVPHHSPSPPFKSLLSYFFHILVYCKGNSGACLFSRVFIYIKYFPIIVQTHYYIITPLDVPSPHSLFSSTPSPPPVVLSLISRPGETSAGGRGGGPGASRGSPEGKKYH